MTNAWPLQRDCLAFYGNPNGGADFNPKWLAENIVHVQCPWPLYYGAKPESFIAIHKKVAPSLTRVLGNIYDAVGKNNEKIKALRYDRYSGSLAYRPMRGGTAVSMHEFGCAIDWDAENNQQHSQKHLFTDDSLLIVKFKDENWVCGLDWSPASIDAMHVQAARVHA